VSTSRPRLLRSGSPGQLLVLTLVLGAAGAGLVFLATRQSWAQVRTVPPRPLPVSLISVTGAALVPYIDALVLVGLASLAAVLATRRLLRRVTGVVLAVLGAALAVSVFTLSRAAAISAAATASTPSGSGAGSVTQGSNASSSAVPNVAGAAPQVHFAAAGWQVLAVAGAIAMIAAGVLVVLNAEKMAVMSSRYDAPTGKTVAAVPSPQADSASVWEALSRGDDPTAAARPPGTPRSASPGGATPRNPPQCRAEPGRIVARRSACHRS
jgi:uncharacterized membrane protein (TIGR02234 family)